MKSSPDEDSVRLRPGSGEDYVLYVFIFIFWSHFYGFVYGYSYMCLYSFPDGLADNLIVEVRDSKGRYYGRTLVQVAAIADSLVRFSYFSNH